MFSTGRIPIAGYATVIACLVLLLFWQHLRIGAQEQSYNRLDATAVAVGDAFQASIESGRAEVENLNATYTLAHRIFKLSFLLVVVLPTALLFPLIAACADPVKPRKNVSVVKASEMTRDDVGRGIPREYFQSEHNPQKYLMAVNTPAFLVPALIMAGFALADPAAYAGNYGVTTLLLFGVGTLMAVSGSVLAFTLRQAEMEPQRIATYLGTGFVILGGLAGYFL